MNPSFALQQIAFFQPFPRLAESRLQAFRKSANPAKPDIDLYSVSLSDRRIDALQPRFCFRHAGPEQHHNICTRLPAAESEPAPLGSDNLVTDIGQHEGG
ncbi:hypothetical protein D3C80_1369800 [compost metagenome]